MADDETIPDGAYNEMAERSESMLVALREVRATAKQTGDYMGQMTCPHCGGILIWAIDQRNKHSTGRCTSTAGCLHWIE